MNLPTLTNVSPVPFTYKNKKGTESTFISLGLPIVALPDGTRVSLQTWYDPDLKAYRLVGKPVIEGESRASILPPLTADGGVNRAATVKPQGSAPSTAKRGSKKATPTAEPSLADVMGAIRDVAAVVKAQGERLSTLEGALV